jgi:4-hydroxythreonine-4-phosphate dehydrogenase
VSARPAIALVQGDATGIGPELMAKLLATDGIQESARILIYSDRAVFERGCEIAGVSHDPVVVSNIDLADLDAEPLTLLDVAAPQVAALPLGQVDERAGAAVLDCYRQGLDACAAGRLAGLCFTPFNKEALHRAGLSHEDETQFAKAHIGHASRVSEFNVIEGMWNARVTSHVPLKDVASLLSIDEIVASIELADRTLRTAGFARPRIAVAALNPHAGDGGAIGREEIDIIRPAVERAQAAQIACEGPLPSDTLYLKVRDGEYDCAVSMYHDQGQIALKLLGFHMGISVHSGLPFPMATPAHGTAFDIVGKNVANLEPTRRAFTTVVDMAKHRASANIQ